MPLLASRDAFNHVDVDHHSPSNTWVPPTGIGNPTRGLDIDASVRLAHEQSIYAYDAYVLECALRYRTPLLSLDGSQRDVARKLDIAILEVEP